MLQHTVRFTADPAPPEEMARLIFTASPDAAQHADLRLLPAVRAVRLRDPAQCRGVDVPSGQVSRDVAQALSSVAAAVPERR